MGKRMTVGSSFRTVVKHKLMRGLIGEEVGVGNSMTAIGRHIWIDLTAGNAIPTYDAPWSQSCSPGILAYHATRAAKPVLIALHEVNEAAYTKLIDRLAAELPALGYMRASGNRWSYRGHANLWALNSDGRQRSVRHIMRRDAVLVLNDPNAITEWAMRPTFAREISDQTGWFRSLSTLGCNVCGIKRNPLERPGALFDEPEFMSATERANWFELIGSQERETPEARDLLLAAIERDASQWAYLISTAATGSWRPKTETRVRAAFTDAGLGVDMAWMRGEPEGFERIKRALFLTKRELHDAANTPLPFGERDGELV